MLSYYINHFDERVDYPKNDKYGSRDKLYRIGYEYFDGFNLDMDSCKIIGVEQKLEFDFFGKTFVGIIDLSYKDADGNIVILDHKTAESPFNKSDKVKKSKAGDLLYYKRQLYIYCYGFYQKYNRFPKKIGWNFIRDGKVVLLDVDKSEYDEAIAWARKTIETIYETEQFKKVDNYFYCTHLCQYRMICYMIDDN